MTRPDLEASSIDKRELIMKKFAIGMSALIVAGCATNHGNSHEHTFLRGVVPAVDATTGVDVVPRSMCSATSYEEDHDRWLSMSTSIRNQVLLHNTRPTGALPDRSRRSPHAYGQPNDGQVPNAVYLVEQFEAELDGSYDAVVQSCRAYNQCMNQNNFAEGACRVSAGMWGDSQDRFHDLAIRISEVRAGVAAICTDCITPEAQEVSERDHPRRRRGSSDHHRRGGHGQSSHNQGGHDSHGRLGPFSAGGH